MANDEPRYGFWFVAVVSTVLFVVGVTSFLCNVVILTLRYTNRQLVSIIDDVFVRNLNFADLFVCVSAIPLTFSLVITGGEHQSTTVCLAHEVSTSFACLSSAANVFVVSINRQHRIADTLCRHFQPRHATRAVAATWVFAVAGAITPVSTLVLTSTNDNSAFWNSTSKTHTCFQRMLMFDARLYWAICKVCVFIAASVALVVSYSRIVHIAHKSIRVRMMVIRVALMTLPMIDTAKLRHQRNMFKSQSHTVTRMSIIIVTSFTICWSPYYVMRLLKSDDESLMVRLEKLEFVWLTLAYFTISLHPFIYGFSRRAIRNAAVELLTGCWLC